MAKVLLTLDLTPDRRDVVDEMLRDRAEVLVYADLPSATRSTILRHAEVLVCVGFPRDLPDEIEGGMPNLRLVQTILAGVDHMPFDRIPSDVTVCSNAGAYDDVLAEHAWALLLAAAKNVPLHTDALRHGKFLQDVPSKGLRGKVLAILGLGAIGRRVAAIASAFGMEVHAINRRGATDVPCAFVGTLADLERVLRSADYVLVSLPLTRTTYRLLGERELGWMKDDAVLVNVARGKIVDEDALYRRLASQPRFRAAFDVWWRYPKGEGFPFSRPFHRLPNFLMTPHVAWNVPEQRRRSMECALENVLRYLDGETPRNVVDRAEYEDLP
jgi:phosphoglycerate dehydrogenase-like enzyme